MPARWLSLISLSPDPDGERSFETIIKRFAIGSKRHILLIRSVEPTLSWFTDECDNSEESHELDLCDVRSEAEVVKCLSERGAKPLVICCEKSPPGFSGADFLSSTHRYVAVYPPCVCLAMCSDPTCRHARHSCHKVCPTLHCRCVKCVQQGVAAAPTFPAASEATS